jgi:hypothetical protein
MRKGVAARLVLALVVIATLLLVTGCGNGGIPTGGGGTPTEGGKPVITSVSFPAEMVADGRAYSGTVGFSDSDGDIVLVELTRRGIVIWSDDPHVGGQTRGTLQFTHRATSPGSYSLTVLLRDAKGNSSSPYSFSYAATEPPPTIAYRVTAGQLCSEYQANEVAGDLKYEGKLIAVTGYVESIDSSFGISVVLVESPGDWFGVRCYFPDSEATSVATLVKGSQATIVGECTGMLVFNVGLDHCRLE